jgi:flavin reductase (DIM6/NTAB) family NADH-FMN oxidoreductase RutF
MKIPAKRDFPVWDARRFLEPGPVVLVSSAWKDRRDIMTMGWHMVEASEPSLVIGYVWDQNDSRAVIRKSGECVINVPTVELLDTVIDIGNSHGSEIDKFDAFGLTAVEGECVKAPLIAECHANFECKVVDTRLANRYNLFVFEVVKAHVARAPRFPKTVHYRGSGLFMVAGPTLDRARRFKPGRL